MGNESSTEKAIRLREEEKLQLRIKKSIADHDIKELFKRRITLDVGYKNTKCVAWAVSDRIYAIGPLDGIQWLRKLIVYSSYTLYVLDQVPRDPDKIETTLFYVYYELIEEHLKKSSAEIIATYELADGIFRIYHAEGKLVNWVDLDFTGINNGEPLRIINYLHSRTEFIKILSELYKRSELIYDIEILNMIKPIINTLGQLSCSLGEKVDDFYEKNSYICNKFAFMSYGANLVVNYLIDLFKLVIIYHRTNENFDHYGSNARMEIFYAMMTLFPYPFEFNKLRNQFNDG